jgi:hypothetical protein
MKNIFKLFILLLVVALSYACSSKKDSNLKVKDQIATRANDTDIVNINFETVKLFKSYKNKSSKANDSTYITLQYVEMVSGSIKEKINSLIRNELIQNTYTVGNNEYKTLQDILDNFIDDFKMFSDENPDYPQNWFYEINAYVGNFTSKILCLEFSQGGYTGGAHGNSYVKYINIDLENSNQLKLGDLLGKGYEAKLNELIDRKFREVKDLQPTDDLEKEGGLFENKIAFNDNFAVSKNGLLFFYNNYEIAPYAAGTTELLITYDELVNLIPENNLVN